MVTKIGIVGAGKLGAPVAVCLAQKFLVRLNDVNPNLLRSPRTYENKETGPDGLEPFQPFFDTVTNRTIHDLIQGRPGLYFEPKLQQVVAGSDIIFIAVQTPHQPEFDGSARMPLNHRADFDYTYLKQACTDLAKYVRPDQTVSIISTVLPGTMTREIVPILGDKCNLAYAPQFIAMGTVMRDYLHPEFILLGGDRQRLQSLVDMYFEFYGKTEYDDRNELVNEMPPICSMSFESAELVKCSYNTFVTTKIAFSNTIAELAHSIPGCNVDDVTDTLKKATDRIVSTRYMDAGLCDGGGCHPRDLIAMSWLGQKQGLYFNLFEELAQSREKQCEWLAHLFIREAKKEGRLSLCLLGKSFKSETTITAGSPALLIADILRSWSVDFEHYDPYIDGVEKCPFTWSEFGVKPQTPKAFLITTKHADFAKMRFPPGSIVVDPHRYIPEQMGVRVVKVGIGQGAADSAKIAP